MASSCNKANLALLHAVLGTSDETSDRQISARHTVFTQTSTVLLCQKFCMSLVLKPILKLLRRPVICAPLKGLEINTYLVLLYATAVPNFTVSRSL